MKVKYRHYEAGKLFVQTQEKNWILLCNDLQEKEMAELQPLHNPGMTFNLLNTEIIDETFLRAEFFVVEPDYLIDVSALAECFRPFGHHPLNYILSRFRIHENSRHILLGNTANFFIDKLVHAKPDEPVVYEACLKELFQTMPFEFTACEDLQDPQLEAAFFQDCRKHFNNIRYIIDVVFPQERIDKEKIIIEPSFVSNQLGLQGRLDLLMQDYSALIELKAGKGMDDFRTGIFEKSAENHYIQMILYLAILEFNLGLSHQQVQSYLLYSRYPVLSKEAHSRRQLREALHLRNQIVVCDCRIQQYNKEDFTGKILDSILPERLNVRNLSGRFYENYLKPGVARFSTLISTLSSLEKSYFFRIYTFIVKELWLSKLGEREYEGIARTANLWSAPDAEKIAAGELLYDLRIIDNQSDTEDHYLQFQLPGYPDYYLPNFRAGDAVVLYERNLESDCINNRQIFKGAIESIHSQCVQVRLRIRQRNHSVLPENTKYALEHDYMDIVFTGMFRALAVFVEANADRKELLLARRLPEFEPVEFFENDMDRSIAKAMAAKDCFLLLGPPGTGKTSVALKRMLIRALERGGDILLLAYTNRAVDEICKTLQEIQPDVAYIRIGSELNCSPEYREHLLERGLAACVNRKEVKQFINTHHVFAGTVASVWNKPDLFALKSFDLAIIDEATQLLEPHLLGILCAKNSQGQNAVRRFVMIGDHKQLPAVILQSPEESAVTNAELQSMGLNNLNNSLFERLYRTYVARDFENGYDMLTGQGRMHPVIAEFPSRFFYAGKLKSIGLPHQQEPEGGNRLHFIPSHQTVHDSSDKVNHYEAEAATELVLQFYRAAIETDRSFCPETIGIITPYRSQIALIRNRLFDTGIISLTEITVDTIERYQGSQRDIIIYSFCLNAEWQLLSMPQIMYEDGNIIDRKLNVVLTRARKQLYITGNPGLLMKNELYRELLKHIGHRTQRIN